MNLILTDVDGVVLQWSKSFGQYCKHELDIDITESERCYSIKDQLGVSSSEAYQIMMGFHRSNFFQNLQPFQDALIYIHKLKREGYQFVAISAVGNSEDIHYNRLVNLNKYFHNVFDDLFIVHPGASKVKYLTNYDQAYWVEDTVKHAEVGANLGFDTFFIDREDDHREQETNHPKIKTVKSWREIYDHIKGE